MEAASTLLILALDQRGFEEDYYERGLVYEKIPKVLTRGHVATTKRVDQMEERAAHAKYLLVPTKFSFPKTVRIYSIILSFVNKCRRGKIVLSRLLDENKLWFSMFYASLSDKEEALRVCHSY